MTETKNIRNIAIVAHVDHGKTTLVDGLLKQSHTFRDNQAEMSQELIMDSGDQERERGITITAKQTTVYYHDQYKINIIDTPGHADFSGEVERTLNMADGVLLIVDAQEGPMPQTKFVLSKALAAGLRPIVVINKIDKPAARVAEVEDEIANLFLELAVDDSQLHYPIYFAIGRDGKAWAEMPADPTSEADLTVIFDAIVREVPAPQVEEGAFQMLVTALQYDNFLGKYAIGRVRRGHVTSGQSVMLVKRDGAMVPGKIDKVFVNRGLQREEVTTAPTGDIVAVTGLAEAHIGETITDRDQPEALPVLEVEAPTLSMYLGPNTSPLKGREGQFTTGRQIGDRLKKELETNVALRVQEDGIGFIVSGRGELHLSVLVESLRREGYEFEVGRPQVVTREIDGVVMEPIEEVLIEVADQFVGVISQELGMRRGEMKKQESIGGATRLTYIMPTRSLIGLRNQLLTATKGTLIMHSLPAGYQPLGPTISRVRGGALIATEAGTATPYALEACEARGILYIGPGTEVYQGMIVGLYNRHEDLDVNVCRAKQLTNIRSKSSDGAVQLTPYTQLSLEQCLDFIEDDELLEVTPKNLRLRKRYLDPHQRKRYAKK